VANITHPEPVTGFDRPPAVGPSQAAADDAIRELLRAYREMYRLIDCLPPLVWMRVSAGRAGRQVRVPRLRSFLAPIVSFHVARSITVLKRDCYGAIATDEDPPVTREQVTRVEDFERSLAPVHVRRAVAGVVLGAFLLAYAMAQLIHPGNSNTKFLGDLTKAVVELDRHGAIAAFNEISFVRLLGSLILSLWAIWLVLLAPSMAFRLKRAAFNLRAASRRQLTASTAHAHSAKSVGIYELERVAFASIGSHAPREIPLDIIERSILLVSLVILGVDLIVVDQPGSAATGIVVLALTALAAIRTVRKTRLRWGSAHGHARRRGA
jgi:hypothetical protein